MESLVKLAISEMSDQHFDCLAVAVIDFRKNSFESFEISGKNAVSKQHSMFFDLASVSKTLNLASCYIMHPGLFNEQMQLLLNHRGGLPAWGKLSKKNWREQILSYEIRESDTLYSDFSAIRLMLEIEKASNKTLKELVSVVWDDEIKHWPDLKTPLDSPVTGMRNGKEIYGVVHDDNAFIMNSYSAHAGLFATIDGLAKTFLNLQRDYDFISKVRFDMACRDSKLRYCNGWDRARANGALAGDGYGEFTFGHLGFTGTSVWIDADRMIGHLILSNATKNYWYDRTGLNQLRKVVGTAVWQGIR